MLSIKDLVLRHPNKMGWLRGNISTSLMLLKSCTFTLTYLNMWNFCVQHVIHLINRFPVPLLKSKSPYELLFKQPPSLIHLNVFGCLSFDTSLHAHRTKFDPISRNSIFIGYQNSPEGYILYDLYMFLYGRFCFDRRFYG